jgi:hypothetical protein
VYSLLTEMDARLGFNTDIVSDNFNNAEYKKFLSLLSVEGLIQYVELMISSMVSQKETSDAIEAVIDQILEPQELFVKELTRNHVFDEDSDAVVASIESKSSVGLSAAGLLNQGYVEGKATDGTSVYSKITTSEFSYVNLNENINYSIKMSDDFLDLCNNYSTTESLIDHLAEKWDDNDLQKIIWDSVRSEGIDGLVLGITNRVGYLDKLLRGE